MFGMSYVGKKGQHLSGPTKFEVNVPRLFKNSKKLNIELANWSCGILDNHKNKVSSKKIQEVYDLVR